MKKNQEAIEDLTNSLEQVLAENEAKSDEEEVEVADASTEDVDEKGGSRRVVMVPMEVPGDDEDEKANMVDEEDVDPMMEEEEEKGSMTEEQMMARRRALMEELEALNAELGDMEKAMMGDGEEMMEDEDEKARSAAAQGAMPSVPVVDDNSDMDDAEMPEKQTMGEYTSMDLSPDEVDMVKLRRRRMSQTGMKEEEIDDLPKDAILCGLEQKMLADGQPCAFCRGGCKPEYDEVGKKELPGQLDIDAKALSMYGGEVIESGYAPNDDIFVVDIKQDGRTIEAFFDGSGNDLGWIKLNDDLVQKYEEKDGAPVAKVISVVEAEQIALKSLDGVAYGTDPAVFEGYDAYAVAIEGVDGKSYDAYVGIDGTFLGYDEYENDPTENVDLDEETAAEVKAIEAELELKRAFSAKRREELAKEGMALPDGSFPIVNKGDLENAIQAFGRASNPDAAKAHIIKRATELGAEDMIPDKWLDGDKALDDGVNEDKDESAESAKEGNIYADLMELEALEADLDL